MKLLKLKTTSGFRMLEKDFEINFLTKTRVDKDVDNNDLITLEDDLYYPIETVFIGKNSSGKTTVLDLIMIVFELLNSGRIQKQHFEYNDSFAIDVLFYVNSYIYRYVASFVNDGLADKSFLKIVDESLTRTTYKDSYRKDLSNASFFKVDSFFPNINGDTSMVNKFIDDNSFNYSADLLSDSPYHFGLFYDWLGEDVFLNLLHLFDDSVEFIKPIKEENNSMNAYFFKRYTDVDQTRVDYSALKKILSAGTIRGINLYAISILVFFNGGHIIVDEIERSFNRNLIENLLLMFNDKSINKKDGSIIYSTHYSELLDAGNRCDNVNVLHRFDDVIKLKNMHTDYTIRTDMAKSSQFNQNTFDTMVNYNHLMQLKDSLRQRGK